MAPVHLFMGSTLSMEFERAETIRCHLSRRSVSASTPRWRDHHALSANPPHAGA